MLQSAQNFRSRVPSPGTAVIELEWTTRDWVPLATFSANNVPISTSLLLFGADPEWEREALGAFQQMIEEFCDRMALEPGRDVEGVSDRPAILSVPWPSEDHESVELVAEMETCLAGAFFEEIAGQT